MFLGTKFPHKNKKNIFLPIFSARNSTEKARAHLKHEPLSDL